LGMDSGEKLGKTRDSNYTKVLTTRKKERAGIGEKPSKILGHRHMCRKRKPGIKGAIQANQKPPNQKQKPTKCSGKA